MLRNGHKNLLLMIEDPCQFQMLEYNSEPFGGLSKGNINRITVVDHCDTEKITNVVVTKGLDTNLQIFPERSVQECYVISLPLIF